MLPFNPLAYSLLLLILLPAAPAESLGVVCPAAVAPPTDGSLLPNNVDHRRVLAPAPVLRSGGGGGGITLPLLRRFRRQSTHHRASISSSAATEESNSESSASDEQQPPTKDEILAKQEETIQAIKACYKVVLFTAIVDVVTNALAVRDVQIPEHVLGVLNVLWKIGFSSGLYQISRVMQNRRETFTLTNLPSIVDETHRIMGRLWRQTAQLIILGSIFELTGVFGIKGTRFNLPMIPRIFTLFAIATGIAVQGYSMKEINTAIPPTVWRRTMNKGEESTENAKNDLSVHEKTHTIARNMALCSIALFLRGAVVTPLLALGETKKIGFALTLSGAYSPIIAGGLLWGWRRNAIKSFRSVFDGKWEPKFQAQTFEAQEQFYTRVKGSLQGEGIMKLLLTIGPLIIAVVKRQWQ